MDFLKRIAVAQETRTSSQMKLYEISQTNTPRIVNRINSSLLKQKTTTIKTSVLTTEEAAY